MTGALSPEMTLRAENDPHAWWLDRHEQALQIILGGGSADGNSVQFDAPKLQITDVQIGDRNSVATDDISYQLHRSGDAGDDELTIVFT